MQTQHTIISTLCHSLKGTLAQTQRQTTPLDHWFTYARRAFDRLVPCLYQGQRQASSGRATQGISLDIRVNIRSSGYTFECAYEHTHV